MKTNKQESTEIAQKITKGLALSHKQLIEYKKKINSPLVVMWNDKIVRIKPWEESKTAINIVFTNK